SRAPSRARPSSRSSSTIDRASAVTALRDCPDFAIRLALDCRALDGGHPPRSVDEEVDDDEAVFWQATVDMLLDKGATRAEAIDGANLILQGVRRRRQELTDPKTEVKTRESGTRLRPLPLSEETLAALSGRRR